MLQVIDKFLTATGTLSYFFKACTVISEITCYFIQLLTCCIGILLLSCVFDSEVQYFDTAPHQQSRLFACAQHVAFKRCHQVTFDEFLNCFSDYQQSI